ncbi:MAG: redoxin domain-containing protein, partial [Acidobacteriia bacterium]|nr:redoxin domain-containing protein [Terriglobia bacterium]
MRALATCLLATIAAGACLATDRAQSLADFFVGRAAPDFRLKDLDGHDVQLSALRGKVVLLEFWASWCGPCRAEIPDIQRIAKKFANKNVVVIGVNSEEPEETVRGFVAKNKMTYRIALAPEHSNVIRQYAPIALPTVAIVDQNGIVAAYRVGERSDTESLLAGDIHHVLSAKYRPPEPKALPVMQGPVMQSPAAAPGAPVVSAAGGPDPNWKPQSAEEFLARGFLQVNRNQYAQARADAEQALKLCPESYAAVFLHGRAAYEQKDYSTAIKDFNQVVEGRPKWAQGYHYRGLSYSYSGEHGRALADYQKMLELDPYASNGYNDLGWALRELKQFDKAIDLEPDYLRARENRAILFGMQHEWKDELEELAIILWLSPNDLWAKNARDAAQQGREFASDAHNTPQPDVHPRVHSKV